MYSVIICEGKTDAVLLSYYLCKVGGWQHAGRAPGLPKVNGQWPLQSQSYEWYAQGDMHLLLWAIGGKDVFDMAFSRIIDYGKRSEQGFLRVAVVQDLDDRTEESLRGDWRKVLCGHLSQMPALAAPVCEACAYVDDFGALRSMAFQLLAVPPDRQGALEVFLLEALSKEERLGPLVVQARAFIASEPCQDWLAQFKTSWKDKAELSAFLAVYSPQKVFAFIDELLKGIPWEQFDDVHQHLSSLRCLGQPLN